MSEFQRLYTAGCLYHLEAHFFQLHSQIYPVKRCVVHHHDRGIALIQIFFIHAHTPCFTFIFYTLYKGTNPESLLR